MALINCPECGKQISDKATVCPNCGYPISSASNTSSSKTSLVRVKLEPTPGVINQKVSITCPGASWTGKTGQVAELQINRSGNLHVLYHSTLSVGDGGNCQDSCQ